VRLLDSSEVTGQPTHVPISLLDTWATALLPDPGGWLRGDSAWARAAAAGMSENDKTIVTRRNVTPNSKVAMITSNSC
jgi:hypothetical protein